MSEKKENLSDFADDKIPVLDWASYGIVVADWNLEITYAMRDAAIETLKKYGVSHEKIIVKQVPGTFELTFGAKVIADCFSPDAVICIGCVIQGETRHFDFICQSVTQGITELNLTYDIPFIFGVLTTDTIEQAKDRAGGKHGNKGVEAAISAIKMVQLGYESKHQKEQ
ncbi:6,7-dimethyl-8-ribityllumazine synthase [Bacteroidota bacterium]